MARRLLASVDELQQLADHSVVPFRRALERLVRSQFGEADPITAMNNLRSVFVETMTLADLFGRRRLLLEAAAVSERGSAASVLPKVLFAETPVVPRLTFLEAVKDLTSRAPLKGFNWRQVADIYQTRQGFALARSADVALTERVQKTIERFMRRGVQLRNAEKIISELGGFTRAYAETVYRTNLATAYSAGRFDQAADPDVAAVIGGFEYLTSRDSDVRRGRKQDSGENHAAADGFIAATTDPIWDTTAPPSGYQCLLPENRLSGRFIGGLSAKYAGPAVEIKTRNGRRLRVTVNHPVLTTSGWCAAGKLRKAQHCVVDLPTVEFLANANLPVPFPETAGRAVHNQDAPATAENVFQAFLADRLAGPISSQCIPLNLHGDARRLTGQVHLVGTYSEFMRESVGLEQLEEFELMIALRAATSAVHALGVPGPLTEGSSSTTTSRPGSRALSDNSGAVHFGPLERFCCGPAARIDPTVFQATIDDVSRDAQFARQLIDGLPGEISSDEIVDIDIFDWRGHVYDFETQNGFIVAEGIPVGNCRCVTRMVPRKELKRLGLVDESGRITRRIPRNFSAYRRHPAFATSRARTIYR